MASFLAGLLPRIVGAGSRFLKGTIGDVISGKKILSAVGTGLQKLLDQDFKTDEAKEKEAYIRSDPNLVARARKLQKERKEKEKEEERERQYEKAQSKAKKARQGERKKTMEDLTKKRKEMKKELSSWVKIEPTKKPAAKGGLASRGGWVKIQPIKEAEKKKKIMAKADEFRNTKEFEELKKTMEAQKKHLERLKAGPPPIPKRRRKLPAKPEPEYYAEPIGPRYKYDDWEKTAKARAAKKAKATATKLMEASNRNLKFELD
jgi:hypothetical protein